MRDIKRNVGEVSEEIADYWEIPQHKKKIIFETMKLYNHVLPHKEQFINDDSFYKALDSVEEIIAEPDYVFYDEIKQGLEYYKLLDEYVMLVVQTIDKRELPVASIYPVTQTKINNRKLREEKMKQEKIIEKYMYRDEEPINV